MESKNQLDIYFGVIVAMVAFFAIAIGVAVFFYRYLKAMLQKEKEIRQIALNHQQELLLNSIESAEKERFRIAKDIHDEIGGIFSTLFFSLNQEREASKEVQIVHHKKLIQSGIDSVRRISRSIVPNELEILGLEQTLENYLQAHASASGLTINFDCEVQLEDLDVDRALACYRIVQELLSNTMKYAQAKNVLLQIKYSENKQLMHWSYQDDGQGMDLEVHQFKRGIGFKNMESRILLLEGKLSFESQKGRGFVCYFKIPINSERK